MLKVTWETWNLNISALRKNLKNLVHNILGEELLYPMHKLIISSEHQTQGGDVSDMAMDGHP